MRIALYVSAAYVLALATWVFYLAAMNLVEHRKALGPVAKLNGYVIIAIGLAFDLVLNIVVATVVFLDPPRELLLTTRLKRYRSGSGWRSRVAAWVCKRLLDQFDPNGEGHCG